MSTGKGGCFRIAAGPSGRDDRIAADQDGSREQNRRGVRVSHVASFRRRRRWIRRVGMGCFVRFTLPYEIRAAQWAIVIPEPDVSRSANPG
jgi:hypothetical protein